ncbi:MAG: helix-turn-helix transcriptional regulator [Clostridia bacterium]|nr:helix-turn-helix transcriptional regulator [Clostridia bacterium]
MSTLGEILKRARKDAGLQQKQVAQYLHIHRTTYTKYETDVTQPPLCVLWKITQLLELDPAWLLREISQEDAE